MVGEASRPVGYGRDLGRQPGGVRHDRDRDGRSPPGPQPGCHDQGQAAGNERPKVGACSPWQGDCRILAEAAQRKAAAAEFTA